MLMLSSLINLYRLLTHKIRQLKNRKNKEVIKLLNKKSLINKTLKMKKTKKIKEKNKKKNKSQSKRKKDFVG
jgi:hypothetical protein